ncbi:MAG: adenylate kinase, partial [Deltaproteobacteria bacterium]|nr:adenylate kinase [Deltaproteobacteria bacterium]
IPQISTGDMLRAALADNTPLGIEAQKFMSAGKLVPDEVIVGLIEERLKKSDCEKGFILDGFPRTLSQADSLEQMLSRQGKKMDGVINLTVNEEALIQRLTGRRQCSKCGQGYHIQFAPSQKEGTCDLCGASLFQREDDREETIRERLKVYQQQTWPLIDHYEQKKCLTSVQGDVAVDEVFQKIIQVMNLFRN